MDEKEKCTEKETNLEHDLKVFAVTPDEDEEDEVIVLPVDYYKHLIRCEFAIELIRKLLDRFGEYSSERGKIIEVLTGLLKKEGPFDT